MAQSEVAFAVGTEIATKSGSVQTALPLVMSRRYMVIFRLPRFDFHL